MGNIKETEREPSPYIDVDDITTTKSLINDILETGIACMKNIKDTAQWVVYSNEQIYHDFECFFSLQ